MSRIKEKRKVPANPLLIPRGLIFSSSFEEVLINNIDGGGMGSSFNVEKTMVLVLHTELEYKMEKLNYKELEVTQPRIKNKSELPVAK